MMLNPFVGKETVHTQAVLCESAIANAVMCISPDNNPEAVEHLQRASSAIQRVLKILDELRERPKMEGA